MARGVQRTVYTGTWRTRTLYRWTDSTGTRHVSRYDPNFLRDMLLLFLVVLLIEVILALLAIILIVWLVLLLMVGLGATVDGITFAVSLGKVRPRARRTTWGWVGAWTRWCRSLDKGTAKKANVGDVKPKTPPQKSNRQIGWDALVGAPATPAFIPMATHPPKPPPSQAQPAPPLPPPGWYQDPSGSPRLRYWDGALWTERYNDSSGTRA